VTKQLPDTEQACLHICTGTCILFFLWPEVIVNACILEEEKLSQTWINKKCELGAIVNSE